ncbi:MAG: DUF1934 domain-containing protein [Ruminococcus sp.]|nr:DUF1934 domain-containing protein [Ruminococcus sp.]
MNIVTNQEVDGEKEVIEMTTLASLKGKADDYYITYTDEDGDLAGCRTTLHVENGSCVTIRREGSYDSHMIIEKNVRHISHHTTPYGSFALGVSALGVDSSVSPKGGKLSFRYATDIDMRPVGEIEFNITLTKRNIQ